MNEVVILGTHNGGNVCDAIPIILLSSNVKLVKTKKLTCVALLILIVAPVSVPAQRAVFVGN